MGHLLPDVLLELWESLLDEELPTVERLKAGATLARELEAWLPELAEHARAAEGESWTTIGTALAITRQAAQQRFGNRRKAATSRYNADPSGGAPVRSS